MCQKKIFQAVGFRILTVAFCLYAFASTAVNFQLVSAISDPNSPSVGGNGDSYLPIITPNGRYILFASMANNLISTNADGPVPSSIVLNVYLHDRLAETTTLVSISASAGGGDGDSLPTGISTNGRYALFESRADNLTPGCTNNTKNIFVRDAINGVTTLVSISTNGSGGNADSDDSAMTPDGRYVAFASQASNLAPGNTNGMAGVFVRDLQNKTTTLVSTGAIASFQTSGSISPAITPDGRFIVFYSTATNLVPGVTSIGEVYVRDLVAGTTVWASTNARTLYQSIFKAVNGMSCAPVISTNGEFVAFEVCPSNSTSVISPALILQVNLPSLTNVLVTTNAVTRALADNQDTPNLAMTPDGTGIAYLANSTNTSSSITNQVVYYWNNQSETNILLSADMNSSLPAIGVCASPAFSYSGGFLTFFSAATNLTATPSYGENHLYLWNVQTGTLEMVDTDTNGVEAGLSVAAESAVSDDGSVVAFDLATNNAKLASNDSNLGSEVFACHPATRAVEMISACVLPSLTPNNFVELFPSCISTNGRYVAFSSEANNLTANKTNECREIFVRDLLMGTNLLVSSDLNGFPATILSSEPCLSGNGRYVAFSSYATNLVAGNFSNNIENVFIRDLQSGTTTLVTTSVYGGPFVCGNGNSFLPVISSDGRFILFHSQSTNISGALPPQSLGIENLFLRDQQLATNYALTAGATSPGVISAAMTPDGHYVAFIGRISGSTQNYLYILNSWTAALIYTNAVSGLLNVAISPDGSWVAYNNATTLWATNLAGSTTGLISSGVFGSHVGLQFSPDDTWLVYSSSNSVYAYNFAGGTNLLVSRSFNSASPASGISFSPVISPNDRFIAYRSTATNIVPNNASSIGNIYLYDCLNNATTLITADPVGTTVANNWSMQPEFSGDGSMLVFQSYASDLAGQSFNEVDAVFALDLLSASTNSMGINAPFFAQLTGLASGQGGQGAAGNPVIQWPAGFGNSYQVQYCTNLNNPVWQVVNGNMILIGSSGQIEDQSPLASQKFYRIVWNNP